MVDEWLNKTQTRGEFVVLAAFGTLNVLHERIWQTFIDALELVSQMRLLLVIPQPAVRAKFQKTVLSSVNWSSRILIVSWIPQQDVLAHPVVRIFISHGGRNSTSEAIYAHVPLIILPGFGDQYTNAAKVEEIQIGCGLNRHTITAMQLAARIEQIQASYDEYIQRLRRIHQVDVLEGGGAQAAAKFINSWLLNGYKHLDTLDHHLPFLVATSLDVLLAFLALLILINYLLFRLIVCLIRPLRHAQQKNKRE